MNAAPASLLLDRPGTVAYPANQLYARALRPPRAPSMKVFA